MLAAARNNHVQFFFFFFWHNKFITPELASIKNIRYKHNNYRH
jgi:hypothetical protein